MVSEAVIIDDEPAVSRVVQACLQRAGYKVRTAATGEEGLRLIADRKPDLVLLDHHLPGVNGLELLARLQDKAPEIKVVMLTGRGNVPLVVEAMNKGASDFLTKPVDFDKLLRVAGEVLGKAVPRPAEPGPAGDSGLGSRLMRALPDGLRKLFIDFRDEFGAAEPRPWPPHKH